MNSRFGLKTLYLSAYAGRVFDKSGPVQVMAVGFGALALAFVLLFLAGGILLFIISAVVMGIGFGIIQPTNMAMAINRVEPFRRGRRTAP
ncbi:MFS transporter [Pelotomaculum propionicicum]|uniref:MFS transporter n=1 Tax=Pelotomaculum propionicicum TaxID=258475 RepID=UPI001FAA7BF9|nr:MFS transporter [Pelotomaculum propionicicum]